MGTGVPLTATTWSPTRRPAPWAGLPAATKATRTWPWRSDSSTSPLEMTCGPVGRRRGASGGVGCVGGRTDGQATWQAVLPTPPKLQPVQWRAATHGTARP